ncbi:hypothetical protein M3Y94_00583300 [Aphelenchoides besseyi]|nr:hypothetical protein M3Y94_00583300 [Aphelenchoides besseyi]
MRFGRLFSIIGCVLFLITLAVKAQDGEDFNDNNGNNELTNDQNEGNENQQAGENTEDKAKENSESPKDPQQQPPFNQGSFQPFQQGQSAQPFASGPQNGQQQWNGNQLQYGGVQTNSGLPMFLQMATPEERDKLIKICKDTSLTKEQMESKQAKWASKQPENVKQQFDQYKKTLKEQRKSFNEQQKKNELNNCPLKQRRFLTKFRVFLRTSRLQRKKKSKTSMRFLRKRRRK